MREYALLIDEALKKGLAPEVMVPFNSQWLWECLGFRCGKLGLESVIEGVNPLPEGVYLQYEWPYPQFIPGPTFNVLVIRDGGADYVYTVSHDYSTVTLIATLGHLIYGIGSLMEVADFGEYIFMTNGVAMIYLNTATGAFVVATTHDDIPLMHTVCNFRGQAIGGGVASAWYDCDETYYIWSRIGSMDFTLECADDDGVRRYTVNEAGYRRCPYGGEVYHVRELGDMAIGYSSKGLTIIHTAIVDSRLACGDAVMGFKKLHNVGLHNKGAMNGDEFGQLYVGEDLIVRMVTNKGVEDLGFKHLMDELDDEDIIVSFDKTHRDFYIGNSIKTYLLTQQGMTEVMQHPSAVWRKDPDELYMIPATSDEDDYVIASEVFDMGYKGQKTVVSIETDATLVMEAEAGVDWANNLVSWGLEHYKPINDMGIAAIAVAGNYFRFRLRFGSLYPGVSRIGYITARYKMTDLRGLRGVYAPPIRGQA